MLLCNKNLKDKQWPNTDMFELCAFSQFHNKSLDEVAVLQNGSLSRFLVADLEKNLGGNRHDIIVNIILQGPV